MGAQAACAPRLVGDLVGARHEQVLVDLLAETLARVHGQMEGDGEHRAGAEQEQKEQRTGARARPGEWATQTRHGAGASFTTRGL